MEQSQNRIDSHFERIICGLSRLFQDSRSRSRLSCFIFQRLRLRVSCDRTLPLKSPPLTTILRSSLTTLGLYCRSRLNNIPYKDTNQYFSCSNSYQILLSYSWRMPRAFFSQREASDRGLWDFHARCACATILRHCVKQSGQLTLLCSQQSLRTQTSGPCPCALGCRAPSVATVGCKGARVGHSGMQHENERLCSLELRTEIDIWNRHSFIYVLSYIYLTVHDHKQVIYI